MLNKESQDIIKKTVTACNRHKKYLLFSREHVRTFFPLDHTRFENLTDTHISYIDQMIFRFSKLQDATGNRLFPAFLKYLGEDTEAMAFRDILFRLEKLEIIPSAAEWLELREIRNLVTHEYPEDIEKVISGLNVFYEKTTILTDWYDRVVKYIAEKTKYFG
jgi:hypothetical protein